MVRSWVSPLTIQFARASENRSPGVFYVLLHCLSSRHAGSGLQWNREVGDGGLSIRTAVADVSGNATGVLLALITETALALLTVGAGAV
jgi:hypothetical protein